MSLKDRIKIEGDYFFRISGERIDGFFTRMSETDGEEEKNKEEYDFRIDTLKEARKVGLRENNYSSYKKFIDEKLAGPIY